MRTGSPRTVFRLQPHLMMGEREREREQHSAVLFCTAALNILDCPALVRRPAWMSNTPRTSACFLYLSLLAVVVCQNAGLVSSSCARVYVSDCVALCAGQRRHLLPAKICCRSKARARLGAESTRLRANGQLSVKRNWWERVSGGRRRRQQHLAEGERSRIAYLSPVLLVCIQKQRRRRRARV